MTETTLARVLGGNPICRMCPHEEFCCQGSGVISMNKAMYTRSLGMQVADVLNSHCLWLCTAGVRDGHLSRGGAVMGDLQPGPAADPEDRRQNVRPHTSSHVVLDAPCRRCQVLALDPMAHQFHLALCASIRVPGHTQQQLASNEYAASDVQHSAVHCCVLPCADANPFLPPAGCPT